MEGRYIKEMILAVFSARDPETRNNILTNVVSALTSPGTETDSNLDFLAIQHLYKFFSYFEASHYADLMKCIVARLASQSGVILSNRFTSRLLLSARVHLSRPGATELVSTLNTLLEQIVTIARSKPEFLPSFAPEAIFCGARLKFIESSFVAVESMSEDDLSLLTIADLFCLFNRTYLTKVLFGKTPHASDTSVAVLRMLVVVAKCRLPEYEMRIFDEIERVLLTNNGDLQNNTRLSFFIEVVLKCCPLRLFEILVKHYCIDPSCLLLSGGKEGAFVIRAMISNPDVDNSVIIDKLLSSFELIVRYQSLALIQALVQSVELGRLEERRFLDTLTSQFGCSQEEERNGVFLLALLSLQQKTNLQSILSSELQDDDVASIECFAFGSRVAQCLLNSKSLHRSVAAVSTLPRKVVLHLSMLPEGSFFFEQLLKCKTVKKKFKQDYILSLVGSYVELCKSKSGSRTFDAIFDHALLPQKILIAEELSKDLAGLKANRFGFFVVQNCCLPLFTRNRKKWEDYISANSQRNVAWFKQEVHSLDAPEFAPSRTFSKTLPQPQVVESKETYGNVAKNWSDRETAPGSRKRKRPVH